MKAVYNEIEPYPAQWLRNLAAAGHIAEGSVDERSISDLSADDVVGARQFHAFAGVGIWSYALRCAGWPDDRPVWTGSCPCQPFSSAGKGLGTADARHLWPEWLRLIRECRPPVVFGEQVASAAGRAWFAAVRADLEALGYAVGAADTCAAGVGAPHIRQRLYFVGMADAARAGRREGDALGPRRGDGAGPVRGRDRSADHGGDERVADAQRGAAERRRHDLAGEAGGAQGATPERQRLRDDGRDGGEPHGLADADREGRSLLGRGGLPDDGDAPRRDHADGCGDARRARPEQPGPGYRLGNSGGSGLEERERVGGVQREAVGPSPGQAIVGREYADIEWLPCLDGKLRPTQPGIRPLAARTPGRVGRLRAYGNGLCAPQATAFVQAVMEVA